MKVNKLIKKLQKIEKQYGNLKVEIELVDCLDNLVDDQCCDFEIYAGEKIGICPDFDDGAIRIQADVSAST